MENAADALKISFAVFVFVLALAVTFSIVGKTRETADVVLFHTDKTNFYELEGGGIRVVGPDEVITTLYRIAEGEALVVRIKTPHNPDIVITANDIEKLDKHQGMDELLADATKGYLGIINTYQNYVEEFSEIDISGMYKSADDGSKITIADGGSSMYITYFASDDSGNKLH